MTMMNPDQSMVRLLIVRASVSVSVPPDGPWLDDEGNERLDRVPLAVLVAHLEPQQVLHRILTTLLPTAPGLALHKPMTQSGSATGSGGGGDP
jgi:hypothetical protein